MAGTRTELQMIKMSEIQSQEVAWLWYPFIPYGKLTIVQGDPGDGKTTLVLNIAAKLSKGEGIDSEMKLTEPLTVIYQSAEDGLADTARSVLLVGRVEGEANIRAVVQIKNNLAAFGHPKAFELSGDGFHWLGDYEITADEVLGCIAPKANKLEQAKRLLREVAETNNAMQSNEIFNLAEEQGISRRTLENAKKELGIKARRINTGIGNWIKSSQNKATAQQCRVYRICGLGVCKVAKDIDLALLRS